MDHIPPVGSATSNSALCVPHIARQSCQPGEFHNYPASRSFDPDTSETDDISWTDASGYTLHERTSIFQEWLFFGTLSEVFSSVGVKVAVDDFINGEYVTTEKLVDYVRSFAYALMALSTETRVAAAKRIEQCLKVVIHYASFRPPGRMQPTLEACPERWPIALSTTSLAESLMQLPFVPWTDDYMKHIRDLRLSIATGMTTRRRPGRMEEVLVKILMDSKWCPNQLAAFPSIDASTAYYLTTLPPMKIRDHSRCSAGICLCDQIQEDYKSKHTSRCSGSCDFLGATTEQLEKIIDSEGLPLVRIKETNDQVDLEVVARDPAQGYVALSHVWSHGLGNRGSNTLPSCQISRLSDLLRQLGPANPTDIWVDTICVPITGHSRIQALRGMGSIYRGARFIIVLDEDLQEVHATNPIERAIRVASSTWQRRLWTLQEASLNEPETLLFQFKGGLEPLNELAQECLDHQPTCLISSVPGKAYEPLLHLGAVALWRSSADYGAPNYPDFQGESPISATFLILLETLAWRNTSRASDEPVCLSTILDIDPGFLLQTDDPEERMKLFLRKLHRIPQDVLFLGGPKFRDRPGMGWASTSFLRKGGFGFVQYIWATLTPEGLPVVANGAILTLPQKKGSNDVENLSGPSPQDSVMLKGGEGLWTLYSVRNSTIIDEENPPLNLLESKRPAVIFRERVDFAKDTDFIACLVELADPDEHSNTAEAGHIITRFCALVSLRGGPSSRAEPDSYHISSMPFGRLTDTQQTWVVG